MLALQQLPSDSEPDLKGSALNLSLYHWVNSEIVCPSIFQCFIPYQGGGEGGGAEPVPAAFGQKGGRHPPARLMQEKQSHLTSISSLHFVCPPNACLWTVAGSQSTQITPADAGESTQTQHREEPGVC